MTEEQLNNFINRFYEYYKGFLINKLNINKKTITINCEDNEKNIFTITFDKQKILGEDYGRL